MSEEAQSQDDRLSTRILELMEWPRFGFPLYMCICGIVDAFGTGPGRWIVAWESGGSHCVSPLVSP